MVSMGLDPTVGVGREMKLSDRSEEFVLVRCRRRMFWENANRPIGYCTMLTKRAFGLYLNAGYFELVTTDLATAMRESDEAEARWRAESILFARCYN
jgi:hypothetical protein